jgi:hypothetical protein
MVGVHWRGSGRVFLRTATANGDWSAWHDAAAEEGDAPEAPSPEGASTGGWTNGAPIWVGSADRVQLNVAGDVRRVRTFFLASPVTSAASPASAARAEQPAIIRRKQWGADESIVRAAPSYADRLAFSVVHHTAGAQPSTRAESAAIVRGIQTYHVKGNGWNDIGYNFLVDRFGQIFEGRGGGIAANVIGAHAQGFNTGSVGVSALGTFSGSGVGRRARRALVRLLAWRLDVAHVKPTSRLTWVSGGNPKYPEGREVRLRAVSGHRDTGPTSCPGSGLYAQLPGIARSVRARGGSKIYAPRVDGSLGGAVRFRAEVEPAQAWTVTIVDDTGATVAAGEGSGEKVHWTWDSSDIPGGSYRWVIAAGDALAATGVLGWGGVPPPAPGEVLELVAAGRSRGVLSPDGDGHRDTTTLSWRTSLIAEVKIVVLDSDERLVGQALPWTIVPPAARKVVWNGRKFSGGRIGDGVYTLRFWARAGSQRASRDVPVKLDRTLGFVRVSPQSFSPNGDGNLDVAQTAFRLARPAQVQVTVRQQGGTPTTVFDGGLAAGPQSLSWDGGLTAGPAADGFYKVSVSATTALGTRRYTSVVEVDKTPPSIGPAVARRIRAGTKVKFVLDEAGPAVVRFGRRLRAEVAGAAGLNVVRRSVRVGSVRVRSWDAAGNPSALVRLAVKPPR